MAELPHAHLQLGVAQAAVVRLIAPAQHVEVDPVHDLDPVAYAGHAYPPCTSSSTAARRSASETAPPGRTAPGASTSTNRTPSGVRFLSRATAASPSSAS